MAVEFTKSQRLAIDSKDTNILVSAAAGSGKTAVLTERIVQMVCDENSKIDIDRLLVVTFTNAAAAEMRERVASKIAEKLLACPGSEHIERQATLIHNAQITTIDSFCLFLLRNHFNKIGIDPAFRIADDGEIKLLQQDVLAEVLEEAFAQGSEAFHHCVEFFCPKGDESPLEESILKLSKFASSYPWPREWLLQRKNDYDVHSMEEFEASEAGQYILSHIKSLVEGFAENMATALALTNEPSGPYMYRDMFTLEYEMYVSAAQCNSLRELEAALKAMEFGRISTKKDASVDIELREQAKEIRTKTKDRAKKLVADLFPASMELAIRQGEECLEPVCELIDLTLRFDDRMAEKKREKHLVDFSDVEHFALEILLDRSAGEIRPSSVAMEYRQYFTEVMIDEYQDSNLVQEYILQAVSGEEDGRFNRFMVGDVKQSIYKFRMARPELFMEKYLNYAKYGEPADKVRIDLAQNFRSRREVIDAVNECFRCLMDVRKGGIPYDDRAALYLGATYPEAEGNTPELLLLQKPEAEIGIDKKEAEGRLVAAKIKELMQGYRVMDKESKIMRPVRYSDIVILLRTTSGWDEAFRKAMEAEGIPAYITSRTGYFAATEVQELLQMLRVLNNPTQDIPLFSVMKSIFGGFSDEEIAILRASGKKCSLYESLTKWAENADLLDTIPVELRQAVNKKAIALVEKIRRYREYTVYMSVRELLTVLVEEHRYLDYVTALPAGSKRRSNVEMLFTKASEFEQTSYYGLFHFVRYMEQLEKYEVDYGEADTLDENADVVRIMSIHKSKGLEFAVTFVSGLGKDFNMTDLSKPVVPDMDLGLGVNYLDVDKRIKNKSYRKMVVCRKVKTDMLAEEMRLLYVAMTRAREKLILTGCDEKIEENWARYENTAGGPLSFSAFYNSSSYLDMLLPILPQTSIQVSVVHMEDVAATELRNRLSVEERKIRLNGGEGVDENALAQLRERFGAVYAYDNLATLYTKTTVSELKIAAMADRDEAAFHTFEEKEVVPYIPNFRKETEEVTGTVRGNAYHRVMELMDFGYVFGTADKPTTPAELRDRLVAFLDRETAEKRLKEEYRSAVNINKIIHFLQSEIGQRMLRADRAGKLYREQPFVLGIDADRLKREFPHEEKVLIQGIIDVFFEEDGKIVLLDYKTDSIDSLEELWNRYQTQIDYYTEAIEKLMQMKVTESYLYSFSLEKY